MLAKPVDQFDVEDLVVEVAVETDEVGFDLAGVVAEGGHGADADGGGVDGAVSFSAAGVDAIGGDQLRIAAQVGGWHAQSAPALVAFDDGSFEHVWAAEADRGVAHAAIC